MTAPSIGKLAVAWKCSGCGLVLDSEEHDGSDGHTRQTGPSTYEQCGPVSPLYDALPDLSGVLGELAVAREAINCALLRTMTVWSEDRESEVGFDGSDVEAKLSAALASETGRLAGELIRAAGRTVEAFKRESSADEHARLAQEVTLRWRALLARFPGMREGAERGD